MKYFLSLAILLFLAVNAIGGENPFAAWPPAFWAALPAAVPCWLLGLFFYARRLGLLLGPEHTVSSGRLLKTVWLCNGLNCLLPGHLAEFVKPYYLLTKNGCPPSLTLSAVVGERGTDLFILLLAAWPLAAVGWELQWPALAAPVALLWLALLTLPRIAKYLSPLLARVIPWGGWRQVALNIVDHLAAQVRSGRIWGGLVYGLLAWLCAWAAVFVFFRLAVGPTFTGTMALGFLAATMLAYLIPGLPGGLGAYEAAGVLILNHYGWAYDQGLLLTAGFHLAQMALAVVGALVIMVVEKWDWRQLKNQLQNFRQENRL